MSSILTIIVRVFLSAHNRVRFRFVLLEFPVKYIDYTCTIYAPLLKIENVACSHVVLCEYTPSGRRWLQIRGVPSVEKRGGGQLRISNKVATGKQTGKQHRPAKTTYHDIS